ncbi:MAG: alpha/beta hydrolase [Cellvibrionales bacterium TMED21]|nr:alpha/beta hydrolase [Halieaceae bacterium]OUT67604.1 MAG: alpha/beta hydrolase [Cellvibrionales bacterium TMED21]
MANDVTRLPFPIVSVEKSAFKETYGGAEDVVVVFCTLIKTAEPSDTCLISMHPIGGTAWLPIMTNLARTGVHVLACDSRYRGADHALNMEKVTLDLGSAVRHAREVLGYKHVVLLGWSGGGSLSAFYQAQAEQPTVESSPCGGGPNLVEANLLPADGLIMMAAHVSRHGTLTEWIDPSILDESDPDQRDLALDIYGSGLAPPFDDAFLTRYRAAQIERNQKITAWVKDKLDSLARQGKPNEEFAFVTHGTMADPAWLDPTIDPSDRKPGWCYLGDPKVVNNGPVGLARFSTLRSWLSQWSYDDANADGPRSLASVSCPVLVIGNTADDACTPRHAKALFEAVSHNQKECHEVKGASHYYMGQPEEASAATKVVTAWLEKQGFPV